MRAPVHVKDFVSPVAVHRMTAKASVFAPARRTLVQEYSSTITAMDELLQLPAADGQASAESMQQLLAHHAETTRLEDAIAALQA
ncbi:hypothetical protein [Streptomyces sp. NPDC006463]|uniref:hypothetical protein n=1 Tax=Streptomyces sp. NPDC006463 TaxID=3364746 RepID=UPI00367A0B28